MIIDFHGHQYPDAFREEFMRLVDKGEMPPPEYDLPRWNLEEHIALLDSLGIDHQILSLTLQVHPTDPVAAADLMTAGNDGLAEVCRRHPDRFTGFVALPLGDVEASLKELRRGLDDLGMKGVVLTSNVHGRGIDGEEFFPLYEEINRRRLPVLIHPLEPRGPAQAYVHRLELWIGWPADTAYAVARLVLNGVLDRFPDMTLVLSHLGGATHYTLGRVCEGARRRDLARPALDYYRGMYYDTAGPVYASNVLGARHLFGAERIVFGTDYPFGPELGKNFMERALACVRDLSLPAEDEKAIFEGNAKRLLGM